MLFIKKRKMKTRRLQKTRGLFHLLIWEVKPSNRLPKIKGKQKRRLRENRRVSNKEGGRSCAGRGDRDKFGGQRKRVFLPEYHGGRVTTEKKGYNNRVKNL